MLLARRFLSGACADYGLPEKTLAEGADERPISYPWPGNIRELFNAIILIRSEEEALSDTSLALELLVDKVPSFGGCIEELSPKGVTSRFGLEPVEDAPLRAAHAAMAIQKAAERSRRGDGERFTVEIAIHRGRSLALGQDVESLEGVPLLLIVTCRPGHRPHGGFDPTARFVDYITCVALDPERATATS